MSVGFDYNASLNDVAPSFPILFPIDWNNRKMILLFDAICVLFLLCLHPRSSLASVVFVFNASLNDVAPFSPILFPIDRMNRKMRLLFDAICVLFLLCLHPRSSFVSVVFVFNASLIDVAFPFPILLPVGDIETNIKMKLHCFQQC